MINRTALHLLVSLVLLSQATAATNWPVELVESFDGYCFRLNADYDNILALSDRNGFKRLPREMVANVIGADSEFGTGYLLQMDKAAGVGIMLGASVPNACAVAATGVDVGAVRKLLINNFLLTLNYSDDVGMQATEFYVPRSPIGAGDGSGGRGLISLTYSKDETSEIIVSIGYIPPKTLKAETESTEPPSRFVGKGEIAGTSIKMQLDIDARGKVSGHYEYTKFKTPIVLSGQAVDEQITLVSTGIVPTEIFEGRVSWQESNIVEIIGRWRQRETGRTHRFFVSAPPDPLLDNHISCEEMSQFPALVFEKSVDLGSGAVSPNSFEWQCPQSLANLEFLAPLIKLADIIRQPSTLPMHCTGTMIHASARYFRFTLAELGYYPQPNKNRSHQQANESFFEEWSYQSLHNRSIYERFLRLREEARPQLIRWYIREHQVAYEAASDFGDTALRFISDRGFGGFPGSSSGQWQPEELVPYTREALDGDIRPFVASLREANDIQRTNSLRRLIVNQADPNLIRTLLRSIQSINETDRSESPLSLAVREPDILELLLDKGFDPNHQNEFGKTPLFYAIGFSNADSVRLLLARGSDVNHQYNTDETDEWRMECIGITHWNRTPLMHAAQHADVPILKMLLAAGANIDAVDSLGATAIDYAIANGRSQNVAFLRPQENSTVRNSVTDLKRRRP